MNLVLLSPEALPSELPEWLQGAPPWAALLGVALALFGPPLAQWIRALATKTLKSAEEKKKELCEPVSQLQSVLEHHTTKLLAAIETIRPISGAGVMEVYRHTGQLKEMVDALHDDVREHRRETPTTAHVEALRSAVAGVRLAIAELPISSSRGSRGNDHE